MYYESQKKFENVFKDWNKLAPLNMRTHKLRLRWILSEGKEGG